MELGFIAEYSRLMFESFSLWAFTTLKVPGDKEMESLGQIKWFTYCKRLSGEYCAFPHAGGSAAEKHSSDFTNDLNTKYLSKHTEQTNVYYQKLPAEAQYRILHLYCSSNSPLSIIPRNLSLAL